MSDVTDRIGLIRKPLEETWKTLPEDEQEEWRQFFHDYIYKVCDGHVGAGALAHVWVLAHEYYRVYGPLWTERR